MEENLKQRAETSKDIAFSHIVKAGKRIYYIDVKRSRNDEMYLTVTESKRVATGEGEDAPVNYERHKIFVYKEDFDKVMEGLSNAIRFIEERQGKAQPRPDNTIGEQ